MTQSKSTLILMDHLDPFDVFRHVQRYLLGRYRANEPQTLDLIVASYPMCPLAVALALDLVGAHRRAGIRESMMPPSEAGQRASGLGQRPLQDSVQTGWGQVVRDADGPPWVAHQRTDPPIPPWERFGWLTLRLILHQPFCEMLQLRGLEWRSVRDRAQRYLDREHEALAPEWTCSARASGEDLIRQMIAAIGGPSQSTGDCCISLTRLYEQREGHLPPELILVGRRYHRDEPGSDAAVTQSEVYRAAWLRKSTIEKRATYFHYLARMSLDRHTTPLRGGEHRYPLDRPCYLFPLLYTPDPGRRWSQSDQEKRTRLILGSVMAFSVPENQTWSCYDPVEKRDLELASWWHADHDSLMQEAVAAGGGEPIVALSEIRRTRKHRHRPASLAEWEDRVRPRAQKLTPVGPTFLRTHPQAPIAKSTVQAELNDAFIQERHVTESGQGIPFPSRQFDAPRELGRLTPSGRTSAGSGHKFQTPYLDRLVVVHVVPRGWQPTGAGRLQDRYGDDYRLLSVGPGESMPAFLADFDNLAASADRLLLLLEAATRLGGSASRSPQPGTAIDTFSPDGAIAAHVLNALATRLAVLWGQGRAIGAIACFEGSGGADGFLASGLPTEGAPWHVISIEPRQTCEIRPHIAFLNILIDSMLDTHQLRDAFQRADEHWKRSQGGLGGTTALVSSCPLSRPAFRHGPSGEP
jgi:hypothetical protein